MKIASHKTLDRNKKTRLDYAYRAIERDTFSEEKDVQAVADKAMDNLHLLTKKDLMCWALREVDFRMVEK